MSNYMVLSKGDEPYYNGYTRSGADSAFDFLTGYFCGKGW